MGFLSNLWDGLTGSGAAKAANKQADVAKNAQDWQQQQWMQYGAPMAELQMKNLQAMQPFQQQLLQYLMGGGQNQPSWMQVPSGNPTLPNVPGAYTPDYKGLESAMSTIGDTGLDRARQTRQSSLTNEMARRGLGGSSVNLSRTVGLDNWFDRARSDESASRALAMNDLRRQGSQDQIQNYGLQMQRQLTMEDLLRARRGEGATNFWNTANYLTGQPAYQPPTATTTPWAGIYGNIGANAQNMASQYGQMAGNAMGGIGGAIGQWYGMQQNKQPQQTTGGGGTNYGGALNNYKLPWE